MVHFTFKNGLAGKSLSVHNSFKSFIIMVVMLVLTTSSAFAEEIDGLNYKLDSETKTAILIPKTNGKYAGDIVVPGKIKGTDLYIKDGFLKSHFITIYFFSIIK